MSIYTPRKSFIILLNMLCRSTYTHVGADTSLCSVVVLMTLEQQSQRDSAFILYSCLYCQVQQIANSHKNFLPTRCMTSVYSFWLFSILCSDRSINIHTSTSSISFTLMSSGNAQRLCMHNLSHF
jgi:hypothetical protein